jgi:putative glutamine amidotransferase
MNVATWIRAVDEPAFARMFAAYPDVRLYNARTEPVPDPIAGLLLTGGSDISLDYLRQPVPDPSLIQDPDPARDAWDFPATERALETGLPILGICRGLQVLNVALGGTLHLDIPHHDDDKFNNVQELRFHENATLRFPHVNSSHHQALDRLGAGLQVEAWHVGDEIIEQARVPNHPFCLAVQFHPERDELYRPIFDLFVEQLRQK